MAVTYKKLFHMLIDRNMSPAQLQQQAGYSANTSTRLRRDYYVSLESVEKICRVLNCNVDDIVDFIPDDSEEKHDPFTKARGGAVGIHRSPEGRV